MPILAEANIGHRNNQRIFSNALFFSVHPGFLQYDDPAVPYSGQRRNYCWSSMGFKLTPPAQLAGGVNGL